jgi:hypothetical protein
MSPVVGSALIAFFAAILGGLVQATFTSAREKRAFRWNMNRENYGLFLQAVAGMARNPIGTLGREPFIQMSIESISRILLQGSPEVIRALEIHQSHGILNSEEGFRDFARLTEAMRIDVGGTPVSNFVALVRSILFEAAPNVNP